MENKGAILKKEASFMEKEFKLLFRSVGKLVTSTTCRIQAQG